MFTINKDGQIKTAKALDRESKAVYELTIRATDRGGKVKLFVSNWYEWVGVPMRTILKMSSEFQRDLAN